MENNEGSSVQTENNAGEGAENVSVTKAEYEELIGLKASYGSLKREMKDLKKSQEKSTETPTTNHNDSELSQKVEELSLRVAGITSDDEIKLAKDLQKETGMPIDKLIGSKYFTVELEALRTERANAEATTGVHGDKTGNGGKQSAAYWIAKGEHPTREQVPDRKTRGEIREALMKKEKGSGGNFYNS